MNQEKSVLKSSHGGGWKGRVEEARGGVGKYIGQLKT